MSEIFTIGDKVKIAKGADNDDRIGQVVTLRDFIEPGSDPPVWDCQTETGERFYAFTWELECADPIKELRRRIAVESEAYEDDDSLWVRGKKFALKQVTDWLTELVPDGELPKAVQA